MVVQEALKQLALGEELSQELAESVMDSLMTGEVHDGLIGAFLGALLCRHVTGKELAGFVTSMKNHAVEIDFGRDDLVDLCGTGGGRSSFNLSTGSALLAAACGAKVAKHGNRAVTSKCGSADVLEALGYSLDGDLEQKKKDMDLLGFAFLFAPAFHPAVRHVGPVRKAMGVRTVFNMLGPLANPAGAKQQLIGVNEEWMLDPMAEALLLIGCQHGFIVHGSDGMDEISPQSSTYYREVKGGEVRSGVWEPSDFGLGNVSDDDLAGSESVDENTRILREALTEVGSGRSECLIPGVAVTLVLSGISTGIKEGAELARQAVRERKAKSLLDSLKQL